MKSAYELAMERLEKASPSISLTKDQKKEIAEVDSVYRAKIAEKRGSDYVTIFVRQLGGTIVPSVAEGTGTIVRIRLPFLLAPTGGTERAAA